MTLSERFPKATPRPWWKAGERGTNREIVAEKIGMVFRVADTGDGEWGDATKTIRGLPRSTSETVAESDADVIVHCVNTYDARDEALRVARQALEAVLNEQPGRYPEAMLTNLIGEATRKIEAALAVKP